MTASRTHFSRRRFLQTTAAASAVFAMPYYVPSTAFGANEKVNTGHIGLGGQGNGNLGKFGSQAIALCDVDKGRVAGAAGKFAEKHKRDLQTYGDYRKLLDNKDIDAVVISTPDH